MNLLKFFAGLYILGMGLWFLFCSSVIVMIALVLFRVLSGSL